MKNSKAFIELLHLASLRIAAGQTIKQALIGERALGKLTPQEAYRLIEELKSSRKIAPAGVVGN